MKGYGEYKKIEAQWLGTIPSHWESPQLREILKERKEKVSDKEFSPLSVCKAGIVPQLSTAAKSNAGDNRKGVRKGDFVINSRSDRRGSSGISKYEGSVSLISHVLSPRGDVADNFLHYLLRSHNFIEEFYRNGRGIVADLWTTRFDEMKTITLPLPPRQEQDKIVRYLDAKVGKINKLIKIKQQQIALLKEKKQAIINQAVTKGLDLSAPMKDSGIAWIGQIPQGWDVIQFSRIITDITQGWSPVAGNGDRQEGQWGVLALSAINDGDFFPDAAKPIPLNITVNSDLELRKGDFLLTRSNTRALVGDVCIVDINTEKLIPSDLIYKLTTNGIENKYLLYLMKSFIGRQQIEQSAHGSSGTMPKITHRHIKSWKILLPPIEEQNKIVNYISSNISVIKDSILHLQRIISTITEYRTRLISEVVTGKVDVRHIYIADNQLTDLEEDYCIEETNNSFNILECKA